MKINVGKHGYVTDEVSTIDIKDFNSKLENRIKSVTDVAAISRGKLGSNNPIARFGHLLKEAAYNYSVDELNGFNNDVLPEEEERLVNTTGRPLEFCPVILRITNYSQLDSTYTLRSFNGDVIIEEIMDTNLFPLFRFSYVDDYTIYTNYRAVYNFLLGYFRKYGIEKDPSELIPFITNEEEAKKFKVLRIKAPMFVWAQFMTHTQLSKISQSDRVSEQEDYWLPDDIHCKIDELDISSIDSLNDNNFSKAIKQFVCEYRSMSNTVYNEYAYAGASEEEVQRTVDSLHDIIISYFLNVLSQEHVQKFLKLLGYKREIYSRAPYYFKYKEFVIGGWLNDPHSWGHLLLERDGYSNIRKSWTQKETKDFTVAVRGILGK